MASRGSRRGIEAANASAARHAASRSVAPAFGTTPGSSSRADGGRSPLPLTVCNSVDYGSDPTLAPASTRVILVTVALLAVVERVAGLQKVV